MFFDSLVMDLEREKGKGGRGEIIGSFGRTTSVVGRGRGRGRGGEIIGSSGRTTSEDH